METNPAPCVKLAEIAGQRGLMLCGSVDIFAAGELREAALQLLQRAEDVPVSCEYVEHLDTSALQIILSLKQALRHQGRNLRLLALPAWLRERLVLSGVWEILQEQAPLEEAAQRA